MDEEAIKRKLIALLGDRSVEGRNIIWQDHFKDDCTLSDFLWCVEKWRKEDLFTLNREWLRATPLGKRYIEPLAELKEEMGEAMRQAEWVESLPESLPDALPFQTPKQNIANSIQTTNIKSAILSIVRNGWFQGIASSVIGGFIYDALNNFKLFHFIVKVCKLIISI